VKIGVQGKTGGGKWTMKDHEGKTPGALTFGEKGTGGGKKGGKEHIWRSGKK